MSNEWKQITDENLIQFIRRNLTFRARHYLGIKVNWFGFGKKIKVRSEIYSVLVELFIRAKSKDDATGILDLRPIKQD